MEMLNKNEIFDYLKERKLCLFYPFDLILDENNRISSIFYELLLSNIYSKEN